ncbi:uncharacterized protein BDV17DRAFT_48115 [Aspergillus undulatus]|uniref:uncharacterized protein n=1 Tax=Aspergillus undulatus TaxID=1810928 RepID=UPI003CCD370D
MRKETDHFILFYLLCLTHFLYRSTNPSLGQVIFRVNQDRYLRGFARGWWHLFPLSSLFAHAASGGPHEIFVSSSGFPHDLVLSVVLGR